MGTPDFAVPALAGLIAAGHEVACVYSQPPRPAGRGHKEQPSPVHAFAASRAIPVRTPKSLKSPDEHAAFRGLGLDVAVVAAYGLILPKAILEAPRLGCVNVHASLLPRWRGAAPIQRALLAGDAETGVTIMQMDEGLDTGAMLLTGRVPIGPTTTASDLHDALAALGADLAVAALPGLADGTLKGLAQPAEGVTYARKLDKDEGRIDWSRPAAEIERMVRALNPWPGVWCLAGGERLKVLAAELAEGDGDPGLVLDNRLTVACGAGALRPRRVQRPGRAPMTAGDMLRGFPVPAGVHLQNEP
jgi:methionyl-tRNA formyltransferase